MSDRYTRKDLQQYLDQCNEQLQMLHNNHNLPKFVGDRVGVETSAVKLILAPRNGYSAVDTVLPSGGRGFVGCGSPSECANKVTQYMLDRYQTEYNHISMQRLNACNKLYIATYEG